MPAGEERRMDNSPTCPVCGYPDVPRPLDYDDVRRGLALVQRSLDEEGWAVGLKGKAICHIAGGIGREQREREGVSSPIA